MHSSRSSGGGGSTMKSFSGGGGGGSKSWSGGGSSSSSQSMRSFRSSPSGSGNSGSSAWSGGGSSNSRARSFSGQTFSGGGSDKKQDAAKQFRSFSGGSQPGGNFSGNNSSKQFGDATREYRSYRAPSGNESKNTLNNFSGNGNGNNSSARRGGNNEQIQQMFKQYKEQQAGGGNKTFDSSRGRSWSSNKQGIDQAAFNQQLGAGQIGGRNRGDFNRSASGNDAKQGNFNSDSLNRFRNGGGNNGPGGNQFSKGNQFGQGGKGRGGEQGQFGKWSNKGGGDFDAKTARWYGKSGFGDHRGDSNWNGDGKWNGGGNSNGKGNGQWGGGKGNGGQWADGKWNGGKGHDGNWNGGNWKDRNQWGDHVRNDWNNNWSNKYGKYGNDWHRGRNWRDVPFAYGWWGNNRNWGYCNYGRGWRNNPWYWWGGCSAPFLTTWVDFGWSTPCYWDYGYGNYGQDAYVTYYNNNVYVDGQQYATGLDYYAQSRNLARSVPTLTQDQLANIEWLPLGVFSVTRPGQAQPTELMQLAVSKDGILSGTLLNQQTGQARPLQGMVEQSTQKAAWMFADSLTDGLVVETSLYNLTEPQCTALAHLDAVSTEVWQIVRLNQPQQPAGGPAAAPAPVGQVNIPPAGPAKPVLPPQGGVQ